MKKTIIFLAVATVLALVIFLFVSKPAGQKAAAEFADRAHSPEEELAGFSLPEGFIVELVASEKDGVINPVDLTFDDAGSLWTQTASMYPLDPISDIEWNDLLDLMNDQEAQKNHPNFKRVLDLFQGKTKGVDKIFIISGLYNKNGPAKVEVWADSLTIPMSILPYKEGAYVAQGSELFFLDDSDKDGKADKRVPLLSGFGFTDTHTMAHSLIRGPGDWIHFSHGGLNKGDVYSHNSDVKLSINYSKIVRFSMDAKKLELETSGLNNIWGYQLRSNGQWYASEANDLGYSIVPLESGAGFAGIGNDRLRDYQPCMPELHKFRVGGTGLSGLAFPDDLEGTFPEEWKNVGFLANPITNTINAVRTVRNPDGTITSEHLPDLLTSKDKYFRPVNMEFGPDGCLYVADWYNKIISHNEVPTSHPDRDKTHGRIWRIRHVSQKPREIPDFYKVPAGNLIGYLKSPVLWEKRSAWHQILDRSADESQKLIPDLVALAGDKTQDEPTRIHALWSLEGLKHFDDKLITDLLSDPGHNVRRETIRSLATFSHNPAQVAAKLRALEEDANPMIRSQVIRTLDDLGAADSSTIAILLRACKPELPGNEMGGSYERRFERFLALKALEQYPEQLYIYVHSDNSALVPVTNKLWAIQALPKAQKEKMFLTLWPSAHLDELDESGFISIAKMLGNKTIYNMVRPVIENPVYAKKYLAFALKNQQRVQSPQLSALLMNAAREMLKSDSVSDRELALDVVGRHKIKIPSADVEAQINDNATPNIITLAIKAIEIKKENADIFERIAKNEKFEFDSRISALHNLSIVNPGNALETSLGWIPSFSPDQRRKFVLILSSSNQGAGLLTEVYRKKLLDIKDFDISSAERINKANPKDPSGLAIIEGVKKLIEEDEKAFKSKLNRYMAIADKKDGDAEKGKMFFQTCLMCHRVGDEGMHIGPALDGLSNRDNESLLTAILDPDAAVERGYSVYRVTRNDNSSVEGFLWNKDGYGITLSYMGGNNVFVPIADVKTHGHIGDRSFMPRGLIDNFNDEQVADLLAYIRTIK